MVRVLLLALIVGATSVWSAKWAQPVSGAGDSAALESGSGFTCAVARGSGHVQCWGQNDFGQLGDGTKENSSVPTYVLTDVGSEPIEGIRAVAAGLRHACVLTDVGGVKCWGGNGGGELGDGSTTNRPTPVEPVGLSAGVRALALGGGDFGWPTPFGPPAGMSCAAMTDGTVKCWGRSFCDQGNYCNNGFSPTPVTVRTALDAEPLAAVQDVTVGGGHTCVLTEAGGVKCWGFNGFGQVGDGHVLSSTQWPTDVIGLSAGVASVSSKRDHTCALMTDGTLKCWGVNTFGQLGNGMAGGGVCCSSATPVDVLESVGGAPLGSAVQLTTGGSHNCALMADGGAKCWGSNNFGELGNGETHSLSPAPVDVLESPGGPPLKGIVHITAGDGETCASMDDGGVKCWGGNNFGEGDACAGFCQPTPADVVGLEIAPDLVVEKSDSADPVFSGETFTYGIDITNRSDAAATNIVVTDRLPAGLTVLATQWLVGFPPGIGECQVNGQEVTCALGELAAGAGGGVIIQAKAPSVNAAVTLENVAEVAAAGQAAPAIDAESTTVVPLPPVLISIGDSVSTGCSIASNPANEEDCDPPGETVGYPQLLLEKMRSAEPGTLFCGLNKWGWTADQVVERLRTRGVLEGLCEQVGARAIRAGADVYVTVTIGANDYEFGQVDHWLRERAQLHLGTHARELSADLEELFGLLGTIDGAELYITEYYNPYDSSANLFCVRRACLNVCGPIWTGAQILLWGGRLESSLFTGLNDVIRQEAADAGATIVDLYSGFRGHGTRAQDPWVYGSECRLGRLPSNEGERNVLVDPHPNAVGQTQITAALWSQIAPIISR